MGIKCDFCGKIFNYRNGISHYNRSKKHYCSRKCLCNSNKKYKELHNKKIKDIKYYVL